jgi:hypothetical protein
VENREAKMARQRSIGVTVQEGTHLAELKAKFETITGEHCDWGQFLTAIALLGLAALENGYRIVTTVCVQHSTER